MNGDAGELEKALTITVEDFDPSTAYTVTRIEGKIPFFKNDSSIDMYIHIIDQNEQKQLWTPRTLNQVIVEELEPRALFVYYIHSRLLAQQVLGKDLVHIPDTRDEIRVVYNFLRAARELSYQFNILADSFTKDATSRLRESSPIYNEVIKGAVGLANYRLIMDQMKQLDGEYYAQAYRTIKSKKFSNFSSYCKLMHSLQNSLYKHTSNELYEINQSKNVQPLVLTAVSDCIYKYINDNKLEISYSEVFGNQDRLGLVQKQLGYLYSPMPGMLWSESLKETIIDSKIHDLERTCSTLE
ncbi:hypothetical protein [Oceanidesulfovibrio marinus]|uniref:Uncharacterized protein n=1 Tax=Oceanidesulfovibrio marinus TaxID=370038 RepID=A0ABX6NL89_9BACT|nr:hypothetical protein [Oceanidesulfovibrio marinus]QJT10405.1 hypothetical protein E8L03_16345 [Oceanidesulfovibrio marinus]